jgi:hypothetical protein
MSDSVHRSSCLYHSHTICPLYTLQFIVHSISSPGEQNDEEPNNERPALQLMIKCVSLSVYPS